MVTKDRIIKTVINDANMYVSTLVGYAETPSGQLVSNRLLMNQEWIARLNEIAAFAAQYLCVQPFASTQKLPEVAYYDMAKLAYMLHESVHRIFSVNGAHTSLNTIESVLLDLDFYYYDYNNKYARQLYVATANEYIESMRLRELGKLLNQNYVYRPIPAP